MASRVKVLKGDGGKGKGMLIDLQRSSALCSPIAPSASPPAAARTGSGLRLGPAALGRPSSESAWSVVGATMTQPTASFCPLPRPTY